MLIDQTGNLQKAQLCVLKHFKNELMYGQRKFKKVLKSLKKCVKHFKKGMYCMVKEKN